MAEAVTNKSRKESQRATKMLRGKTVRRVRSRRGEVYVEFEDGTRLFVDQMPTGLELSVTGLDDESKGV